ncbi:type II secretion system F family protein [soil metagenome]
MSAVVALLGAVGIVVLVSGLPPLRASSLARRIEPYLSGLHGRPSNLLRRPRRFDEGRYVGRLGARIARSIPLSHEGLTTRLRAAGDLREAADLRLEQCIWALAGIVSLWALVVVAAFAGTSIDALVLPPLTVIAGTGGFLARDWWLGRQIENRMALLQEELPTAIDLVTLSIMAGESVAAAFARVGEALRSEIGREFGSVVADVRAGSPVSEALETMKQRVPIPGVSRFVDALVTGIERGSPLADVLRAQAEDGREARRRWLLEVGGRREVLMLVPVVFLIMPVVVVFTLLPGLVALDLLVP